MGGGEHLLSCSCQPLPFSLNSLVDPVESYAGPIICDYAEFYASFVHFLLVNVRKIFSCKTLICLTLLGITYAIACHIDLRLECYIYCLNTVSHTHLWYIVTFDDKSHIMRFVGHCYIVDVIN